MAVIIMDPHSVPLMSRYYFRKASEMQYELQQTTNNIRANLPNIKHTLQTV